MDVQWAIEDIAKINTTSGDNSGKAHSLSYGTIIVASTITGGKDGWKCALCAAHILGLADHGEEGFDDDPFFRHMTACAPCIIAEKWKQERIRIQHVKYLL